MTKTEINEYCCDRCHRLYHTPTASYDGLCPECVAKEVIKLVSALTKAAIMHYRSVNECTRLKPGKQLAVELRAVKDLLHALGVKMTDEETAEALGF
jgi:DNA-directed RNA polymerase subunit RPC12/RpoP